MSISKMKRKNVEDLGDDALRARVMAAEAIVREVESMPAAEVVRTGKADENLGRLRAALTTIEVGKERTSPTGNSAPTSRLRSPREGGRSALARGESAEPSREGSRGA